MIVWYMIDERSSQPVIAQGVWGRA